MNPGHKVIARILVLGAFQAKPSVQYKDNYACCNLCHSVIGYCTEALHMQDCEIVHESMLL